MRWAGPSDEPYKLGWRQKGGARCHCRRSGCDRRPVPRSYRVKQPRNVACCVATRGWTASHQREAPATVLGRRWCLRAHISHGRLSGSEKYRVNACLVGFGRSIQFVPITTQPGGNTRSRGCALDPRHSRYWRAQALAAAVSVATPMRLRHERAPGKLAGLASHFIRIGNSIFRSLTQHPPHDLG